MRLGNIWQNTNLPSKNKTFYKKNIQCDYVFAAIENFILSHYNWKLRFRGSFTFPGRKLASFSSLLLRKEAGGRVRPAKGGSELQIIWRNEKQILRVICVLGSGSGKPPTMATLGEQIQLLIQGYFYAGLLSDFFPRLEQLPRGFPPTAARVCRFSNE